MKKETIFQINWEGLDGQEAREWIKAISYLLKAIDISITETAYHQLHNSAKKYFRIRDTTLKSAGKND